MEIIILIIIICFVLKQPYRGNGYLTIRNQPENPPEPPPTDQLPIFNNQKDN